MRLQFDANQQFQLDAVAAVVDLFDGQPRGSGDFTVINTGDLPGMLAGQGQTELGLGNDLLVGQEALRVNARAVQERNDIEIGEPSASLESWEFFDAAANVPRICPHFSVEMETGTGKTYVYLRTIFELSRRYGFQKFIIVVPSVAIREGVLKNIQITTDHFRALYNNLPFEHFVYDAKKVSRLRQFAVSNTLQILVINIDAFRKNFAGTEAEQKSNVIYKRMDQLNDRQPIEFIQAARPIVIIDEPQSVDATDRAQEAIRALNPLCTLRYSATHRNPYNLVYRLDPVRAFELRLVKQIIVANATSDAGANDAFVRVEGIDNLSGVRAKLRIYVQGKEGPKERSVTVRGSGADLAVLSEGVAAYQDGYSVAEINAEPGNEFIRFTNGQRLGIGAAVGGSRDDVWRVQIRHTIKRHLDKELELRGRGIKVLTLIFIDRVANYRGYEDGGQPAPGKFAVTFEAELAALAAEPRYAEIGWLKLPVAGLHNGYFAQDSKGSLKDTRGNTQADDDVYDLIMKDKERLLSVDEPLRFIFSHSALREGWDNPNVFQICTLNETKSAMKKRQEIGRGLRLAVDQTGTRVRDESVNKLYVMANESYEEFAKALQSEYEEECGVTFGKVPLSAIRKLTRVVGADEVPIGRLAAEEIYLALVTQRIIAEDGRILPAFQPDRLDFKLELPEAHAELAAPVVDLVASYQMERHVQRERQQGRNALNKAVQLGAEFEALWDRIKPRTTYRVEFSTDELVAQAVKAVRRMPVVAQAKVHVVTGRLTVGRGGVEATMTGAAEEVASSGRRALPDLLAYLQNQTELTRSTLVRILRESGRLSEFFNDPQRFMDAVVHELRAVLHRLVVDGIKYERIPGASGDAEWQMMLFKDGEAIDYLNALKVTKSPYEYVVYDSDVERRFAQQLDLREDIKVFAKLPRWFQVETPIGPYNPDWAILKHRDQTLYLVRETKSTKDFWKLRTTESDKVKCGAAHFLAIGVPFAVAVSAADV